MKKILVILGHPDEDTLNGALSKKYTQGAKQSNFQVEYVQLGKINFDPILHQGYKAIQELEPDLADAQQKIKWADHLVLVFPIWWTIPPALLKGFLDRIILPGFGYKFEEGDKYRWKKLLKGKSARLIMTMDAPVFIYKFFYGQPAAKMMKGTLGFCGISPIKKTFLGNVKNSGNKKRQQWLGKVYHLGLKGK